jgi:hypothetical protein
MDGRLNVHSVQGLSAKGKVMSTTAMDPVSAVIDQREETVVVPAMDAPVERARPNVATFLRGVGYGLLAGLAILPLGALSGWIGGAVGQAMARNAMNP